MLCSRVLACTALAALCISCSVRLAAAQGLFLEGRGGVVIPTGDLSRLERTESSSTVALGSGYVFGPHLAVRADVGEIGLNGRDIRQPSGAAPAAVMRTISVGAELAVRPREFPFFAAVNAGVGAADAEFESFTVNVPPRQSFRVTGTHPMLSGGLRVGYRLGSALSLYVSGEAAYVLFNRNETKSLALVGPEATSVGPSLLLPLTLGLRLYLAPLIGK